MIPLIAFNNLVEYIEQENDGAFTNVDLLRRTQLYMRTIDVNGDLYNTLETIINDINSDETFELDWIYDFNIFKDLISDILDIDKINLLKKNF